MGVRILARHSTIDYGELFEQVESLWRQGKKPTAAIRLVVDSFPEHGKPDRDSIKRTLQRRWKKKYGTVQKTGIRKPCSRHEALVYPGLGVLYQVLDQKADAIREELGLPLSEERKRQLVRSGKIARQFLEARREQLQALGLDERERQVRNVVIDLEGVDPAALVAYELKTIEELLERIELIFDIADLGRGYLSRD